MLQEKSARALELDNLVTVVIPTLNEEEAIQKVLEELGYLGLRNILVVDGYSTDNTVDIAKQFGARVVYQHGKGKTGALRTAIEHIDTPYMVVMDGDFTYDASSISRLLQHMNSYDEVIGARVSSEKSMSRLHKFGNRVISKIFNTLMSTALSDVCSGMYLLKATTARELDLATSGFDVEVEIATQISTSGSITEVPINYRQRIGKQKLSTWRHGFKIIGSIFRLARSYNPGVFYSMIGSLIIIPAALLLLSSILEFAYTGRMTGPWFIIGVSMLLVSIQAMSVGVVSLILRRIELRTARRLKEYFKTSLRYQGKRIE